jgi:putative Mn2+ efflux pump MntP
MVRRIAASMSLVAFAVCLLMGLRADNTVTTILANALLAMAGTFAVGLVVGAMAQKMLDENLAADPAARARPKDSAESKAKAAAGDR